MAAAGIDGREDAGFNAFRPQCRQLFEELARNPPWFRRSNHTARAPLIGPGTVQRSGPEVSDTLDLHQIRPCHALKTQGCVLLIMDSAH